MSFLEELQLRLRNRTLKRLVREKKFQREERDFTTSERIAILFEDVPQTDRWQELASYVKKMQQAGKSVRLLGYVAQKHPERIYEYPLFTSKDVDWQLRPTSEVVQEFLSPVYDLLLVINPNNNLHLEFISTLCKAHLRIGPPSAEIDAYDLMIETNEAFDVRNYLRTADRIIAKTKAHGS